MTRIVYGVSGEGSGHSSRAREMLRHLVAAGHEVRVASYDRGLRNLRDDFEVHEIEGLHLSTEDNRVQVVQTFLENLGRLPEGARKARALRRAVFKEFQPEVVITDFEPITAYFAHHYGIPLISLDNQHRMRWMEYECPEGLRAEARLTEAVIRAMVPRPDVALVTTFYFGRTRNERTFLYPPILRREVRELQPETGAHTLVYFTQGFDSFLQLLQEREDQDFVVYGTGREGREGRLRFEAPSQAGFLEHLRTARAVIATAGFTLMSEALHLGKPMLALPMHGQFEQELNAHLLQQLGGGRNGRKARAALVGEFYDELERFRSALATWRPPHEERIEQKLLELVADGGREAARYRALRKGLDPELS